MLGFFRKHQKYFFVFVTTIIVISFSFFGVINSLAGPKYVDPVVHTAIDGTKVKKSELEQFAYFLSTDAQDKIYYGGKKGLNFLNDGALEKDFLKTGLAQVLAKYYKDFLQSDFDSRAKREKYFELYRHPQAEFISVENAWNFLAPDMKRFYQDVKNGDDPLSEAEFNARVELYLGQRKLSPYTLKQVLAYQNKQYSWVPEDPNLAYADLSVFGYKTVDDWFGPRFLRLASAIIIDVAKLAEQQGLKVSDDEALASLLKQTRMSFDMNKNLPYFDSVNVDDYLREHLRLLHLDMNQAVSMWKQVLLFRRYFDSVGDSILVDRLPYKNFANYANLYVAGSLFELSEDMRLSSFNDLQRFEFYLNAVAKSGSQDQENLLALPTEFQSPLEVMKKFPEFVQKRYKVEVAHVDTFELMREIGTKEMWDWQMQDENWKLLQKSFADLALIDAGSREERFNSLDSLSKSTKDKVDQFSRETLLKENSEWIDQALYAAKRETRVISIRLGGGISPLPGIEDGAGLSSLLDQGESEAELSKYSEDNRHYYHVKVLESAPEMDVLTFSEVKNDGTLDERLRTVLVKHYENIRENTPLKFQGANGEWKSFADARDLVAKDYFSDVLLAVNQKVASSDPLTVDDAARYRFTEIMENLKTMVSEHPNSSEWIREEYAELDDRDLIPRPPLVQQWKLVKSDYKLSRSGENNEKIDRDTAFSLEPGEWSEIYTPPQGGISFFQLAKKSIEMDQQLINQGMTGGQDLLSNNAKKILMDKALSVIEEREPIKLDYLISKQQHAEID